MNIIWIRTRASVYVLNNSKVHFLGKRIRNKIDAVLFSSHSPPNHLVYLVRRAHVCRGDRCSTRWKNKQQYKTKKVSKLLFQLESFLKLFINFNMSTLKWYNDFRKLAWFTVVKHTPTLWLTSLFQAHTHEKWVFMSTQRLV